MSKFIEKLKRVGEAGPISLGFGAASRQEKIPLMLMVGALSLEALQKRPSLLKAPVDAFFISSGKGDAGALADAGEALSPLLWGLWIEPDSSAKTMAQAKEIGGDFMVFNAEGTSSEVLLEEDMGKIVTVGLDLDESVARGIEELPIDAVVLVSQDDLLPLTVRKLIDLQATRSLVAKGFLLAAPTILGTKELICLRDLGVDGLIVDLEKAEEQALLEMRQAIEELPKRRSRAERVGAVLPHAGLGFGSAASRREEEDDEEEEDE